jgi:hypothetical protein
MTERAHDALLGRTEGTACHNSREPVKAVRLHLIPPAATPQDGAKSPSLIVKRLGVAFRPTPGITSGAMRRRCRARPETAARRRPLGDGETARRQDGEMARTTTPWRPIDRLRCLVEVPRWWRRVMGGG